MSNPVNFKYEEPKGSGPGCAKLFGWGCLGLLAVGAISTIAGLNGLNINEIVPVVAVAALVIFLVVRSRKARASQTQAQPQAQYQPQYQSQPQATQTQTAQGAYYVRPQNEVPSPNYTQLPGTQAAAGSSGAKYGNPLCMHRFTEEQIDATEALVCACGNYFESADIKKYQKLFDQRVAVNDKIQVLQSEMRAKHTEASKAPQVVPTQTQASSTPAVAAQEWKPSSTVAAPTAAPAAPAAPVKPTFKKPSVTFSLQQWLIIGAAVLVMVAGSSFVVQGVAAGWPEWLFLAVTGGVGLATGFGAFFMRRTSIVVSTFMAAFSSAMQLTSLWTIGALISKPFAWHFDWKTQPGWWWATELLLVAIAAVFLARASRLSGWKAIALLSLAASAVTLELGPVRDLLTVHADWALINLSIVIVTSVGTLYLSKILRAIPRSEITDDEYRDYYEDLAERQDKAFFSAARFATLLQIIAGVGATIGVVEAPGIFSQAPNLIPIFVLVLVASGVSLTAKHWADQLFNTDEPHSRIVSVANGTAFIALAAGVISATSQLLGEFPWANALVALIAILAVVWFSPLAKALAPSLNLLTAMTWSSAGLWLLWNVPTLASNGQQCQATVGSFLIGFSIVLTVADFRLESSRNTWPSIFVNGVGLITIASASVLTQSPSAGHTLTVLALALAANVPLALRWLLQGRKQAATDQITAWIAFGVTAFLVILATVANAPTTATLNDELLFALAFMVYSVVAQVLALRGPLAGKADRILSAHHYLGQGAVAIVGLELRYSPAVSVSALTLTELLIGLIAINYGFGVLLRQASKLHVGFLLTLAAFFLNMWNAPAASLITVYAVQLAFVAAVTAGHIWALNRRTETSAAISTGIAIAAVSGSFVAGLAAQDSTWRAATSQDSFAVLGLLAAFSLGSFGLSAVKRAGKAAEESANERILRALSLTYAAFGIIAIIEYATPTKAVDVRWFALAALALFSLATRLNAKLLGARAAAGLFLVSNLAITAIAATLIQIPGMPASSPEPYTILLSLGLIASVTLFKAGFEGASTALLIDTPILGTAAVSLLYGVIEQNAATSGIDGYRRILASALLAGFSLLRVRRNSQQGWLTASYISMAAFAASAAFSISSAISSFKGPEIYSLLIGASLTLTTLIAGEAAAKVRQRLLFEVPAVLVAALSLGYGVLGQDASLGDLRRILGAGLIAAIVLVRLRKSPSRGTIALAYLSTVATALAIASTVQNRLLPSFNGPEVYSLLAALAVLGVHRLALQHLELKSSLFSWGLPIGIALLPSTFWTYTSWGVGFSALRADQVAREMIVLVVSATLLTLGLRRGNLANASMGVAGLTLLVVPAVASQSTAGEWQVQNTALAAGLALVGILSIARMAGKASGSSMLFFGIPITLALAPSLFYSLAALGHSDVGPADWWRFSILIAISMVMLVLGTMREVAGLFYPGLVGVLLTALPYGFKQASNTGWFLWVLLLAIAGVMVWLAMRLEKMRKQGRTSSQWLRELK